MVKSSNISIHANGVPEVKQRVNRADTILEWIIAHHFSKLTEDIKL